MRNYAAAAERGQTSETDQGIAHGRASSELTYGTAWVLWNFRREVWVGVNGDAHGVEEALLFTESESRDMTWKYRYLESMTLTRALARPGAVR